jgi:hypothetical protein
MFGDLKFFCPEPLPNLPADWLKLMMKIRTKS